MSMTRLKELEDIIMSFRVRLGNMNLYQFSYDIAENAENIEHLSRELHSQIECLILDIEHFEDNDI